MRQFALFETQSVMLLPLRAILTIGVLLARRFCKFVIVAILVLLAVKIPIHLRIQD
jgi:hypothetical protein